ncbi:hypothetical protein GGR57DRAFT_494601 [Xylariaceae sp. FL1272]|nr:hypothetical protein GGR57DRAFT_494601 [Xylariaceae sp. FL1272]
MWNSIWLRTEVLVSFILVFVSLFVVTIVLFHVSETNQGLSAEDAARQYGWRYGPTALLTVVLSLWVQVDYANKILIPWEELRQGPAAADRSILVEYISPFTATTFWRALTRRHWAITASILGTLLIQLATIFSAGLFVLEPTVLERDGVPIAVANGFDGNDFYLTNLSSNGAPTVLYFGTRVHGLSPDPGVDTAKGLVVSDFAPISSGGITNGTNYTATVPGVQSDLECENVTGLNGTMTSLPWYSILGQFFITNITTPSCSLTNVIVGEGPDHDFYHQKNATQAYQGYFYDLMCDPSVDWSYPSDSHPLPTNRTFEHRVVMTMADLRFAAYNASLSSPAYIYVHDLTVAVCKASYDMGDYDVTYTDNANRGSKTMVAEKVSTSTAEIPGFASAHLGAAVQYSLEDTHIGTGGDDWVLSMQVATFYQILSAMNGGGTIGTFMDPDLLIRFGTEAFNGIATQLIHKYMMKPTNTKILGSMLEQQNRLWVRELSVGFMAASFLLLSGLSIVILCARPINVVPSDPGSIGATALILAESSKLRDLLSGLGASRSDDITRRVLPYNFRSILSPGFRSTFIVEPVGVQEPARDQPEHSTDQPRGESWWIPSSVKWWFQVLAVLIPLVLIAVLEVIQRLSDEQQGFLDVNEDGFAISHGFSTYIPALVAFIVSSMFSSMQLAVCLLVPWFALHRGSATASRSLFLNLTNRLAPHRMYLAIKNGNVGALLIMVATFLAAWLPIIVSGLYSIVPVPSPSAFTTLQSDVFDFRQNNTVNENLFYNDNLAGTVAGLIAYNGLAYPKWTFNDLVFNALQTPDMPHGIPSGDELPFTMKLQATRPSLQCDVIPQSVFIDTWDSEAWETGYESVPKDRAALNHTAVLPWMCDAPLKDRAESFSWFQGFALPTNGTPMYFGHASVLSWSNESVVGNRAIDTDINQAGATMYEDGAAENWVGGYGCPSFSVTLGRGSAVEKKVKTKNSTRTTYEFDVDITSIMCKQYLETVEANVTLTLPSLGVISPDTPPIPDESTANYLTNILPYHTGHVFEFALNELLLTLTSGTGNVSFPAPKGGIVEDDSLDNFVRFLGTVNASSPIESYIGRNNTQNLIDATNRLYKVYMPQAISNNLRSANISSEVNTRDAPVARAVEDPVSAQVGVPNRLRLKQETAPKLVLQILLAVMVICAIGSRVLLRGIDKVVPHNPSTIAGRAALFADGEVSTRKLVPFGAEWQTESELKRSGVFEGWLFSLGWWESWGEYKYGVDVGWIESEEKST